MNTTQTQDDIDPEDRFVPMGETQFGSLFDTKTLKNVNVLTHVKSNRVWWFDDLEKRWMAPEEWVQRNTP